MNNTTMPFRVGQTLLGPLFNEPMRVETVSPPGATSWALGLVGAQSERFRRVTVSEADMASITILDAEMAFNGDGNLLRLGIQAYSLGIAYEFDPYFGLSISRVDPLPHQLEAVYEHLLKLARCATITPATWAMPTSKTGCCTMSMKGSSGPFAKTRWKASLPNGST